LFVAALGATGLLSPMRLLAVVSRTQSQFGLYLIAGLRLLVGTALLLAAPSSRAPLYLQILGGLSVVSGIVALFVGVRRFEAILAWCERRPPWTVRLGSACVVFFGLSLLWAVLPVVRAD
jgi:hypothetical protein